MSDSVRETVFYYRAHTLMAVRYGDYKAHYVTRSGWNLDPPEVYKCDSVDMTHTHSPSPSQKHDPPILYHLGHDPSEAVSLTLFNLN